MPSERPVDGLRRQAELGQKLAFAHPFPLEIVHRIAGRDQGIGLGVPLAVIDAIEDAGEDIGAGAQSAIQAEAVLGSLDLAAHRWG